MEIIKQVCKKKKSAMLAEATQEDAKKKNFSKIASERKRRHYLHLVITLQPEGNTC